MKDKIEQDIKKSLKYKDEIKENFQEHLDGKISFGVVLYRLLSRKIIYIKKAKEKKEAKEDET